MAVCKYCTVTNVLVLWTGALVLKPWVLQLKMDYSEQSSKKKKKVCKIYVWYVNKNSKYVLSLKH